MLRWLVVITAFTSLTGFAWLASARGYGLPGLLDKPVSTRPSSPTSRPRRGPISLYCCRPRHHGRGLRGGAVTPGSG